MATRRTLYGVANGQPACHNCKTQQQSSQHCYTLGHHEGHLLRRYRTRSHAPGRPASLADPDTSADVAREVPLDGARDGAPTVFQSADSASSPTRMTTDAPAKKEAQGPAADTPTCRIPIRDGDGPGIYGNE